MAVSADAKTFNSEMAKVNRSLRTLDSEFKKSKAQMGGFEDSMEQMALKSNTLTEKIGIQKNKVKMLEEQYRKVKNAKGEDDAQTQKMLVRLNQAKTQMANMNNELRDTSIAMKNIDSKKFENDLTDIDTKMRVLNSEYDKNRAKMGGFENGMEQMSLRSETLTDKLGMQKDKVKILGLEYQRLKREKGEDNEETQEMLIRLNQARTAMSNMETELNDTNDAIRTQSSRWNQLGERLDDVGNRLKATGDKVSSAGRELTTKVTVPLLGVAAASSKVGIDFESAMSEVKAMSDTTGNTFVKMEEKAMEMGKKTSKSATDSANALKYMSLAGWDTKESIEALEPVLRLSEAGNIDLGRAADLVTDSMSAMGLTVEDLPKYLDMVAQASRTSNTEIDMMTDAFIGCGGTLKGLNVPLDESATLIGTLANRGIKGSEAGNKLNSVLINLTKGTGESGKAMRKLKISAYDSEGKFKGVTVVLTELKEKLKGCTQEQRQQYLAMIGGKTQIDTLNGLLNGLGTEYDNLKKDINNSNGALNEIATTMQDNTKGSITKLKSALEGAGIVIFKKLKPAIDAVTKKINEWIDKFNELSPAQQKNIVKIGAMVAAIGPLLFVGGKLITLIGGAISVISAVSTGIGVATGAITGATGAGAALGTVFTVLTGPVGLVIAGIAALTIAGVALYKHLKKDCIPEVDLFGDTISKATKKAVGGYMELDDKATQSLMHLKFSSCEVSKETASTLIKTFDDMGKQIKEGMDTHFAESHETMQNFFLASEALTDEEEEKILADMTEHHQLKKEEIDSFNEEIKNILTTASNEKRSLTSEEQKRINDIQNTMKTNAITALSENELEAKTIMARMSQQADIMTARQCADVVKNSLEQKNKAIENANSQYDATIKAIIKQRDEAGTITSEQADKLIADATRQRDEVVGKAEDMHNKVIEQAKLQSGEHVDEIDWETGEVLNKWELFKVKVKEKWSDLKKAASEWFAEMKEKTVKKCDEIKKDIATFITKLKNTFTTKFNEFKSVGSDMLQKLKEGMVAKWEDVRGWVSSKVSWLKEKLCFWRKSEKEINQSAKKVNSINMSDIPKYATGTSDFEGGITYVGEKGTELIEMPSGESFLSPSSASLMSLPAHTKIYTNAQTRSIMSGQAYKTNSSTSNAIDYNKLATAIASVLEGFKSEGFTQNLTINSTQPLSPAETAKQNRRALEDLAMLV